MTGGIREGASVVRVRGNGLVALTEGLELIDGAGPEAFVLPIGGLRTGGTTGFGGEELRVRIFASFSASSVVMPS